MVKPDLVAPYESIATTAHEVSGYTTTSFGGTSGSAPIIAGCAAQVIEMYSTGHFNNGAGTKPTGSLTKAFLIANSGMYNLANVNRDEGGWGYPDSEAVYTNPHGGVMVNEDDGALTTGQQRSYTVSLSGDLRVSLVWTDPEGSSSNPATPLVNDLNLRVVQGGTTYYGNNGMKANLWTQSGTGTGDNWNGGANPDQWLDDKNNVENVWISGASG